MEYISDEANISHLVFFLQSALSLFLSVANSGTKLLFLSFSKTHSECISTAHLLLEQLSLFWFVLLSTLAYFFLGSATIVTVAKSSTVN